MTSAVVTNTASDHLELVRQAEHALDSAQADIQQLCRTALPYFGSVGRREFLPFAATLRASHATLSPAARLTSLTLTCSASLAGLSIAGPAARASGGASGAFLGLRVMLFALGALFALRSVERRAQRVAVLRIAAAATAVGTISAAYAVSAGAAFAAGSIVAMSAGAVAALVPPLLFDYYRPELRGRLIGASVAATLAGVGVARTVLQLSVGQGLTWRAALLILAVPAAITFPAVVGLKEPVLGATDEVRVAELVREHLGGAGSQHGELESGEVRVATLVRLRRVAGVKSFKACAFAAAAFGTLLWGIDNGWSVLLRDRWGLLAPAQQLSLGLIALAAAPAVVWLSRRVEIAARCSLIDVLKVSSRAAVVATLALVSGVVAPSVVWAVLLFWTALVATATAMVCAAVAFLASTRAEDRPYAAGLLGLLVYAGTVLGPQNINSAGSRFGVQWGFIVIGLFLLGAAGNLGKAIPRVTEDMTSMVGSLVEQEELRTRVRLGQHLPLLSCRHINFAYGQVQVLFDVTFTVDDGEMVALLGTNGAGKSTLLRLVSGLELPSSGSIHYRGADVTYLGSERRVELGISQIPGGKASFGTLTVMDNLRAYGYTLGRNKAQLDRGIDEAMAAMPRLAERRNQLAATLSGGERQMLALAKAFLLKPRLLAIDELSLGLAPKIVGELLVMVREINAAGTAIVLVEQSVNVALSVVEHAYFMEKGEMRFDGVARDLIERPDILRSVFLEGASKGLTSAGVGVTSTGSRSDAEPFSNGRNTG